MLTLEGTTMKNSMCPSTTVLMSGVLFLTAAAGCSYSVEEPMWDKPFTTPATPAITQIQPSSAPAGVNTILITGQNLNGVPNTNGVYFDLTPAEVVNKSSTSILVRRPSLVTTSCTVKVVSDSALVVAKSSFGAIDQVMDRVGDFRDNITLATVSVDSVENLHIVSGVTPVTVWTVTPAGDKTVLSTSGISLRPPNDAALRNGVLYLAGNNREIQQINLSTGAAARWTQLPSGRVVKTGAFDADGYYYTGGAAGSDLIIVPPNPPSTLTLSQITLSGSYAAEEILSVRISKGYVYVASRPNSTTPVKIWRHPVVGLGQIGAQELFLDLGTFAAFSSRVVRSMEFSSSGLMYLATDSADPLLVFNPASSTPLALDNFYKGIVPPNAKNSAWGHGSYMYVVIGDAANADPALRWNIARVNVGATSAPIQ